MNRTKDPKGYVLVVMVLTLLVFSILSIVLFRSYLIDTKHQVMSLQYDKSYFLAQGAYERAQFYFTREASHNFDGNPANDTQTVLLNMGGATVKVRIQDTYQ